MCLLCLWWVTVYLEHLKAENTKCWQQMFPTVLLSLQKCWEDVWMIRLLKKKSFSWQIDRTVTGLRERNWHLKDFLCKRVKSRDKEEDRRPSVLHSAAALSEGHGALVNSANMSFSARKQLNCPFLERNIRLLLSPIIFPLGLSTARQARWWKTTRPLKFCKCPRMRSEVLGVIFIITPHHQALSIIGAHTCIGNVRIDTLMQLN